MRPSGPLKDILTNGFLEKSAYDEKRNLGSLLGLGIRPQSVKDDIWSPHTCSNRPVPATRSDFSLRYIPMSMSATRSPEALTRRRFAPLKMPISSPD